MCMTTCLYRLVVLVLRMAVHGLWDLYLVMCHSSSFHPQPLIVIFWLLQESEVWLVFDEAVNNLKWSSFAHSALNVSVCCCRSTSSRKNRASHRFNTRLRHGRAQTDWCLHWLVISFFNIAASCACGSDGQCEQQGLYRVTWRPWQ